MLSSFKLLIEYSEPFISLSLIDNILKAPKNQRSPNSPCLIIFVYSSSVLNFGTCIKGTYGTNYSGLSQ